MNATDAYDVIVIGAGPAGSFTSGMCARKGLKTLLIDRKQHPGLPIQCSGLVSKNIDSLFRPPRDCIQHTVKGAIIHSPNRRLELFKKQTAAYVLDRSAFDTALIEKSGADKLFGSGVESISIGNQVSVKAGKTFTSLALVGADGPSSLVRRHFHQPTSMVPGLIAIDGKPSHEDYVELFFDRRLTDGFLWRIPRGGTTEYGMLGSGSSFTLLKKFFKLREFKRLAGPIPMGMHKTFFDRTLLVGDAASQTKPWSGGGIVYGLTCGKAASETLHSAIRRGDLSEAFLSRYEKEWHKEVGKNIKMGLMLREFYKSATNSQIDTLLELAGSIPTKILDMDFPLRGLF